MCGRCFFLGFFLQLVIVKLFWFYVCMSMDMIYKISCMNIMTNKSVLSIFTGLPVMIVTHAVNTPWS